MVRTFFDANLVDNTTITAPVVIAGAAWGGDDIGPDDEYRIEKRNITHWYAFVVEPDSWDNVQDQSSTWRLVDLTARNSTLGPTARVVSTGTLFPCKDANGMTHPQSNVSFALFLDCDDARTYAPEVTNRIRGSVTADSTISRLAAMTDGQRREIYDAANRDRHNKAASGVNPPLSAGWEALVRSIVLPDGKFRTSAASLQALARGNAPLWISCGLGCCQLKL